MKKTIVFFCLIFAFAMFCKTGISQEKSQSEKKTIEPLSEYAKQWLEEVVPYIITDVEKEIFANLPNEVERGKFIENFWKKRDPDPQTPENEFKEDYYRRIALANKFFGSGGIKGWRTDRGRIYIILGPPNEIQRDMSPTGSFGSVFHGPREIWNYWGLPNPRLPYNVEFVFVDKLGTGNYVLEQSLKLTQGGSQQFDLNSSHYYFDYLEIQTEAMRNPFEGLDKLKGVITTQVTYDRIPIEYALYRLKGPEGKTYVSVVVQIPSDALTSKHIEGETYHSMTLMIIVSNNLGQIVSERSKDFNFKLPGADSDQAVQETHQAQMTLALEPGVQKIHFLVLDNFSGKVGTLHQDLPVPGFTGEELLASDIILSSKKNLGQEARIPEEKTFAEFTQVFRKGEEIDVYIEVYNLSFNPLTGLIDFKVEYTFLQNEKILTRIPSPPAKPTHEKDCRVQSSFRLKNFKPGEYVLQVWVTDLNSGKEVTRETRFIVSH